MAVDLRASKTGYLTLDQAAAINASDATLAKFVAGLPKAELHLHTINYGRKYKHAFRPSKSRRVFLMRGSFANK